MVILMLMVFVLPVCLLPEPVSATTSPDNALLQAVDLALTRSDNAMELKDSAVLGQMEIASAEHEFDTKIVPLTSLGFTEGTGTQQLGLEMQKEVETGATVKYGMVGTSYSDDSSYVLSNSANARAYVKVSQGLFRRWGSRYALNNLNVAQLRDKADEISAERSRQGLILSTVKMYYDLVLGRQLLQKYENAFQRAKEYLEAAKDRQAVGLVSKGDVYRAELAMLSAENGVDLQKRSVQRAHDQLFDTLRLTDAEPFVVSDEIRRMVPVIPDGWEDGIYQSRLDWQAQRVNIQINRLEMFQAERDLLPDVGLSFVVEQKGQGDDTEEALNLDETNWSVQLEMLSSLDSFSEQAALARKKIERGKIQRKTEALRRQIKREARDGFLDLVSAEKALDLNNKRLKQAEMALDLAKIRYEKGLTDNLEIMDAEAAFSDAEMEISRSLTQYNVAAVTLANNLGVLDRQWLEMSLPDVNPKPGDAAAVNDNSHENTR